MKNLGIILALCIACSYSCESQHINENIVLIGIDTLDRGGIAKIISLTDSLDPKVIAIDLQFSESKGGSDMKLVKALWGCENLVMPTLFQNYGADKVFITLGSRIEFSPPHSKTGFINAILEKDERQTLRKFIIYQEENMRQDVEYHFSVRTAMSFDSLKAIAFVKDHPKMIDINYDQGNRKFKKYSPYELFSGKISRKDIEHKIVLIGILGPGDEDKFFTPMVSSTLPNRPDMYGLEILANIVAQVLER